MTEAGVIFSGVVRFGFFLAGSVFVPCVLSTSYFVGNNESRVLDLLICVLAFVYYSLKK